ncbi:hypothetical protein Tco_0880625 [Tanacetum coccineum]
MSKTTEDKSQRDALEVLRMDSGYEDDEKIKDENVSVLKILQRRYDLESTWNLDEYIKDSGFSNHMTSVTSLAMDKYRWILGRVTFSKHDSETTKDGKVSGRSVLGKKRLYVIEIG